MKRKHIVRGVVLLLIAGVALAGYVAHRGHRLYQTAKDWRAEIRYLIENGGTIGETPAAEALDQGYLEAVFGADQDLLAKLRAVIAKGMTEDPSMNLGEIAAMLVTYHKTEEGGVEDVAAHIFGGFPLGQRKRGFHRDGFFRHQIDNNLWNAGNSALAFLGRDILVFADEAVVSKQQELLESILSGNIMTLVKRISDRPLFYTAVFPDPRRVVPPQLRPHVQALIVKGQLSPYMGEWEMIVLTPKPESASYALSMIFDMRLAAAMALESRWQGVELDTQWGKQIPVWWAYEMAQTMKKTSIEKEQNIVRLRVTYERVMVNATLKSIERMGRDMAQMQGSLDERLDPRLVDARLKSTKPLHYWTDEHRWGPNWPVAMPTNLFPDAGASTTNQVGTPATAAL